MTKLPECWARGKRGRWAAQLVNVDGHFVGGAIEVLFIACCSVGLELQDGQHVHVVDPVAGFVREPVGLRILPLTVGKGKPVVKILFVFGLDIDFERHDAEDGIVDVIARGDQSSFRPAGQQKIEALDEAIAEIGVVSQRRISEGSVPRTDLVVDDGVVGRVRRDDEVLTERFANLLRSAPRRPVVERKSR